MKKLSEESQIGGSWLQDIAIPAARWVFLVFLPLPALRWKDRIDYSTTKVSGLFQRDWSHQFGGPLRNGVITSMSLQDRTWSRNRILHLTSTPSPGIDTSGSERLHLQDTGTLDFQVLKKRWRLTTKQGRCIKRRWLRLRSRSRKVKGSLRSGDQTNCSVKIVSREDTFIEGTIPLCSSYCRYIWFTLPSHTGRNNPTHYMHIVWYIKYQETVLTRISFNRSNRLADFENQQ